MGTGLLCNGVQMIRKVNLPFTQTIYEGKLTSLTKCQAFVKGTVGYLGGSSRDFRDSPSLQVQVQGLVRDAILRLPNRFSWPLKSEI